MLPDLLNWDQYLTIVGCFAVLRCKNRDILMNSLSIGTILGLMHGSFIISLYSPLNHVIRASHSKVVGISVLVPTGYLVILLGIVFAILPTFVGQGSYVSQAVGVSTQKVVFHPKWAVHPNQTPAGPWGWLRDLSITLEIFNLSRAASDIQVEFAKAA